MKNNSSQTLTAMKKAQTMQEVGTLDISDNYPKIDESEHTKNKETFNPLTPRVKDSLDRAPTSQRTPLANVKPLKQTTPKPVEKTPAQATEDT